MKKKLLTGLVMGFLVLGIVGGANAATVFLDDFEDSDTSGWLESTGGSGSIGVELHNSSQMAFAKHTGSGLHSLSLDFNYLPNERLAFDMHAVASKSSKAPNGAYYHGRSGVTISFLNAFNIELGSAGLYRATNPGSLGPNDNLIDGVQHNYNALMSDYATLAGLGGTDQISKISLNYSATGQTSFWGEASSASVWFDNVTVSDTNAVPIPGAVWLLSSGLIALGALKKKKNHYSN